MREGLYKFVPEFILPKYKGKILESIVVNGEKIGNVLGLNLKEIDYSNEEILKEYIREIIDIKEDNYKTIYIEEVDSQDIKIKELIERETNLKFATGNEIKYYNIPLIIEDIFKFIKKDILKQEVLLIVDNKKDAIGIIKNIKDMFNFISLIGLYGSESKEIYKEVLEKYGISIYQPLEIRKSIGAYDLIINSSQEDRSYLKGIKRTIIFDFNRLGIKKDVQRNLIINDIKFNIKDHNMEENIWIGNIISSESYESIFPSRMERYYKVSVGEKGNYYNIEEYIDESIRIKGMF